MTEYSPAKLKEMQEEATRRVREMNRRYKSTLERANSSCMNENRSTDDSANGRSSDCADDKNLQKKKQSGALNFLQSIDLKKLITDKEQSLVLLIILILMNEEGVDDYLVYALIYIML